MFSRLNTLFGVHVGNMDLLGLAAEQQQQQMQLQQQHQHQQHHHNHSNGPTQQQQQQSSLGGSVYDSSPDNASSTHSSGTTASVDLNLIDRFEFEFRIRIKIWILLRN